MLGSLDVMHVTWKTCPKSLAGMFKGKSKKPTIALEALASGDLYTFHCFFGIPGSLKDINIIDRSPFIDSFLNGDIKCANWNIPGNDRSFCDVLTDGIYPNYRIFQKTMNEPIVNKHKHYDVCQEAIRKDVERCFGVLQARWHILVTPSRLWFMEDLHLIVKTCINLHNMIIRFNGNQFKVHYSEEIEPVLSSSNEENRIIVVHDDQVAENVGSLLFKFRHNWKEIKDESQHYAPKNDLIEHLWQFKGGQST
jgi:hypothetical protein